MITPRVTRLVRVPDFQALHAAAFALCAPAGDGPAANVRRRAVIVPTRGAADELRRTLENRCLAPGSTARTGVLDAMLLPDLLTRGELYERLHDALRGAPPLLTAQEREVLLRRAARGVASEGTTPPFTLRPGLILQMLAFYDELHRREKPLDDFARLVTQQLEPNVETDRGAERLLRQTEFLAATFAAFERLTHATGGMDEHGLRALLLDGPTSFASPYDRIIVTVPDVAADPRGLYATDFVLLTRLGGLDAIDVIATESLLASGFHERVHNLLPGIEEERMGSPAPPPVLVAPETDDGRRWFVMRDREEELADLVRELKHRAASPHEAVRPAPLDRCAVVFQRPLPYLYLARQVFDDGGLPYEAADALPLSAEPFAAALDVVLSFLIAEANRATILELLRSPHFRFAEAVAFDAGRALDEWLRDLKYAGGWDRLAALAGEGESSGKSRREKRRRSLSARAAPALNAAAAAASALRPVLDGGSASAQLEALLAFLKSNERLPPAGVTWHGRHVRARAAVLAAIESLRDAHARHDDEPLGIVELAGSLRRWIEAQTFAPRTGMGGVRLLDGASAPYADVDELRLLGLVEHDWPEPVRRSIFYPASILSQLGWPADAARGAAARAHFHDLLTLPVRRVSASTFTLEDDAMVPVSPLVEELETAGLTIERQPPFPPAMAFEHEAVMAGLKARPTGSTGQDVVQAFRPAAADDWLELRMSRTPGADARYHGLAGARPTRTYAVSSVERYLDCPFKYFAAHVLQLPEEREEETGLTPLERGQFVHEVFEQFFTEWHGAGQRTITTGNVAEALDLFARVVEARLPQLPEADRALERTYLLGSAAASGLGERAFAFEIEQGGEVVERLLEHELEGTFQFKGRSVAIRAKADRIDLMADGTMRVIDYKLSRAPKPARALQLAIYGVCATQALDGHRGRRWTLTRAGYVAFREKDAFVPLGGRSGDFDEAIADGQERFLQAIDGIERGEFPVRPDEPFRCQWCGYAGVCRKDYVGDE